MSEITNVLCPNCTSPRTAFRGILPEGLNHKCNDCGHDWVIQQDVIGLGEVLYELPDYMWPSNGKSRFLRAVLPAYFDDSADDHFTAPGQEVTPE